MPDPQDKTISDKDMRRQHREQLRSINRLLFRLFPIAGVVGGLVLVALRNAGYLPDHEYPYSIIMLRSIVIAVFVPALVSGMLYLSSWPGSKIWMERLGALTMFIGFPVMIFVAIARWFNML